VKEKVFCCVLPSKVSESTSVAISIDFYSFFLLRRVLEFFEEIRRGSPLLVIILFKLRARTKIKRNKRKN
jgi:hypothetical protein